MNRLNLKYGLIAIAALGLSANVSARDLTCADIEFTPAAFEAYEYAEDACLGIVERGGITYAKFTATKVVPPNIQQGVSTYIRFNHNDGSQGPRHKSNLPRNYLVLLDDQPVRLADINEGQEINIYVAPEFWVSNLMVEEAIVEEVVEEVVEAAVVEEIVEEMVEEELAAELPKTAGPLPWLALFGSLFLILGGALRLSRKQ